MARGFARAETADTHRYSKKMCCRRCAAQRRAWHRLYLSCARPGEQLARNKRLDSFFVRDLNAEPGGWALADQSFDAVLCCVSVQYLQQARGGSGLLSVLESTPCMAGTEVCSFFSRDAECLASCAVCLLTGMRMLRAAAGRCGTRRRCSWCCMLLRHSKRSAKACLPAGASLQSRPLGLQ
jgi:hypothetical protein